MYIKLIVTLVYMCTDTHTATGHSGKVDKLIYNQRYVIITSNQ